MNIRLCGIFIAILICVSATIKVQAFQPNGPFLIEEKMLLHFFVEPEDGNPQCTNLKAVDLPDGARFDSETGLFTWLPDYGDAGSYSATFSCNGSAVHQVQIDVAAATPNYIDNTGPEVTLVGSSGWGREEYENDQKSLASLLGVYGLNVETVEELGTAFDEGSVGEILVIPWHMANALDNAVINRVVSYVDNGGFVLVSGRTSLTEALGIVYTNTTVDVHDFMDYLNPDLPMVWSEGETVEVFTPDEGDTIFTVEKNNKTPINIGRKKGAGRILYVGTRHYDHYSTYGTKGHPYLLYHFILGLQLELPPMPPLP